MTAIPCDGLFRHSLWLHGKVSKVAVDALRHSKATVPAARRLLKDLLAERLVESVRGRQTLAAGSTAVECYARKGFRDRPEAALARWHASRAG